MKFSIHDELELKDLLAKHKIPAFRFGQIENAVYKNYVTDFSEIQTIPKELRELLDKHCFYQSLLVDHEATSSNGQTTKFLFKTED